MVATCGRATGGATGYDSRWCALRAKKRTTSTTTRLGNADRDSVTDPWLPAMSDTEKTLSGPASPSAPEGNRTPGLQFEKLASLANGDSGSAVE